MGAAGRFVRPREPSFRFPALLSVLIAVFVPALGPGHESETTQSLLQQRDKTRDLPSPILPCRSFLRLGGLPMSPGVFHVVVGLAYPPLGLTLTALGFRDVVHDIRDSVVQFVQHMRGTIWNENSIPCLSWKPAISRSRVVRSTVFRAAIAWAGRFGRMFFRAAFFRAAVARAVRIGRMFFGSTFLGAAVLSGLRKLLYVLRLALTSRGPLVGARGVRGVLLQHDKCA